MKRKTPRQKVDAGIYPHESQKLDVIAHLDELRKRILICLGAIIISSACATIVANDLLVCLKKLLPDTNTTLIFITPTEGFTAYVAVVLLAGVIAAFPVVLWQCWKFCAPAFAPAVQRRIVLWFIFALVLFACGLLFSYMLVIPAALSFLIGFGQNIATPAITLGKYISFVAILLLSGGLIFEMPVVIGMLADTGIVTAHMLRRNRQYAILIMLSVAAIVTPTRDIINMVIFSLPMLLLYEVSIIIARVLAHRRRQ
jgi:sec-independent protein translocase protein TatC